MLIVIIGAGMYSYECLLDGFISKDNKEGFADNFSKLDLGTDNCALIPSLAIYILPKILILSQKRNSLSLITPGLEIKTYL